ncbi:MAG: rRNA pseudouridine synthase [Rhodospirillales bacterium]|nr:rRNA pseudouridine synthase [Rhodospirillales bacterium]
MPNPSEPKPERIAKVLARAGLCSRRDAERWVAEGRVKVNGKILTTPAVTVIPSDTVQVDGKPLPQAQAPRLWRYHKPPGLVTSHRDPEGRPTVFERLDKRLPRVVSVGRLDLTSEGLLLLTNDGGLARRMELPSTGWLRRYRVRVHGTVSADKLASLKDGITISGIQYGPIKAALDSQRGANAWLTVSLTEGKNREIRKVMEHLGLTVTRLIRTTYGPFQLGHLEKGQIAEVPPRTMLEQLGTSPSGDGIVSKDKLAKTGWAKPKEKKNARPRTKSDGKNKSDKSSSLEKPFAGKPYRKKRQSKPKLKSASSRPKDRRT